MYILELKQAEEQQERRNKKGEILLFSISNLDIKITRGDTAVIALALQNKDGSEYVPQEGDIILLTVKSSVYTKEILIQKKFTDQQIKINPDDTNNLSYGKYYYDVQLTTVSGDVFTVITPHKFEIQSEVTWSE